MNARAFVRAHARVASPPLVPEVRLHLAAEATPLWEVTQAWLDARDVPPPYWAFAWAGGQAVARHVLDRPELVRGRSVLDFGAGGGVVSIAAALAGASRVVATEIDPLGRAALELNAEENGVAIDIVARDVVGDPMPGIDVVLAGDMFYEREPAARHHRWFCDLAARGALCLAGDPARAYAPQGLVVDAVHEVPVPVELESVLAKSARVLRYRAR